MTEQKDTRVLIAAKVKPQIKSVIDEIANREDRSTSYVVARLLESHPDVREKVEQEQPLAA